MTTVLDRARTGLATALIVRLQVVSANSGRPLHGRSVRLWPCDRLAELGGTAGGDTLEVRIADETGWTEFDRLLPPAGPGHWPHLHFEIPGDGALPGHRGRLALPLDAYGAGSPRRTDLAAAFAAGRPPLIASVTGDTRRGLVATRTLAVSRGRAEQRSGAHLVDLDGCGVIRRIGP